MKTPSKKLENVAVDRSKSYERKRRASEKEYKKHLREEAQHPEPRKYNSAGIWINEDVKPRRYIVVSRKFDDVFAAACPCVGQIATNSKLLAYFLYHRWTRFAYKNSHNGYTIAVMLMKRTKGYPYSESAYEAIKR